MQCQYFAVWCVELRWAIAAFWATIAYQRSNLVVEACHAISIPAECLQISSSSYFQQMPFFPIDPQVQAICIYLDPSTTLWYKSTTQLLSQFWQMQNLQKQLADLQTPAAGQRAAVSHQRNSTFKRYFHLHNKKPWQPQHLNFWPHQTRSYMRRQFFHWLSFWNACVHFDRSLSPHFLISVFAMQFWPDVQF